MARSELQEVVADCKLWYNAKNGNKKFTNPLNTCKLKNLWKNPCKIKEPFTSTNLPYPQLRLMVKRC